MAILSVTKITRAGVAMNLVNASSGGDSFPNDGNTFFVVRNAGAAAITVTIATPARIWGIDIADLSVNVGAGDTAFIGPFPEQIFNDENGRVNVSYSAVTSVTVGAFSLIRGT